ncbi:PTS fructose IIA subunit family protein [Lysobacter pythonis]|uniref:PTS fructose IIA subunit family protein n=1 Tax=Solilutibacter pythonis TaxID=2483112 RepID=A0A3M2I1T3_9GAMM|nr:PTS fructose IIA subunit family protein [Lysobacter pythonis]RMH94123.1 PTS fructose IIA subunit family protein [Lysobacter pythonis]
MSVGILLVTHTGIGPAVHASASRVLGQLPLATGTFEVPFDANLAELLPAASAALRRVDGGQGVLVLTDLFGASPSNLAAQLARLGTPVRRVAGLNLPMLLRVMNYPEQSLDELQSTASVGGRNAVLLDDPV